MTIRTSEEIIKEFCDNNYPHDINIPGNRVFSTDSTISTLVLVEGNVVIEYYMMLPNVKVPMHSHPFANQMIFLGGQLIGYKQMPGKEEFKLAKTFTEDDVNQIGSILPKAYEHGFDTGPLGCTLYNIQIWDKDVENPLSAAIEYLGTSMGPIHEAMMKEIKAN